jgi:hypothetical protein
MKGLMLATAMAGLTATGIAAQEVPDVALVIAIDVLERQPVGEGTEFSSDVAQLVAWTRVTGLADTTVRHVWRHQGHERVLELTVGGSPWRTWSRKNIPAAWTGDWSVEVLDAQGNVLATAEFTVGGS